MLKLAGKADRMIWLILYGVFLILMGCMIILSITGPQHNLIPWQMALGTGLGTVFLLAAFFLWNKFSIQKIKRSTLFYRILLISFGILLYTVSCLGRNSPASFVDYYQVWNAAKELSSGGWNFQGHGISDCVQIISNPCCT